VLWGVFFFLRCEGLGMFNIVHNKADRGRGPGSSVMSWRKGALGCFFLLLFLDDFDPYLHPIAG
jgi:hypothetical protein